MDGIGVPGACGSPENERRAREGGEKEGGREKRVVPGGLIYGGFPFNEIVSVTEPVKGP